MAQEDAPKSIQKGLYDPVDKPLPKPVEPDEEEDDE
jgi:hypothetical protein